MPTNNLAITYLSANQNQPEVPVNAAVDTLELALTEMVTHNFTTDANYTLATGTTPPEWHYAVIKMTDTATALTAGRNVFVPDTMKQYVLVNATAQTLTLTTTGGSGIAVATNKNAVLYCDGTNVIRLSQDS